MRTYCNPLNLNYNIQLPNSGGNRDNPGPDNWFFREAADPSVVIFDDEYYLFSSVTKGYWVSADLCAWEFIALSDWSQLPNLRHYAPTAVVLDGVMYLAPGNSQLAGVFKTSTPRDPASWSEMPDTGTPATGKHYPDAQLFYDEEFDKLYYTYGCSPEGYIHIQELDKNTFTPCGMYYKMFMPDPDKRGWERPGGPRGNNDREGFGWVEGAQIFKHNGKYYWIYSLADLGNGYCNGVYVSDNIAGPYSFQQFNPCTQKLTGFAPGAGHGEIFKDKHGNWWTVTCQNLWKLERFERRISMFPTCIDENGQLFSDTRMGDYPVIIPDHYVNSNTDCLHANWNLLSYKKPVRASSVQEGFPVMNACDEDIRSWWSAKSGDAEEWFMMDLEQCCEIYAIQVNFAEQNIRNHEDPTPYIQYQLMVSDDEKSWRIIIDKADSCHDTPHDYVPLAKPVSARYVKIVNYHVPFDGNFALRGLRLFGVGKGKPPVAPDFSVYRNNDDLREATLCWTKSPEADGYVIRYGIKPDELFHSQQIYGLTEHKIRSLNSGLGYYFTVDSFNPNGYAAGNKIESG